MNQLKYTKTHEWVRNDNLTVAVGITNHAQELLGDLVFIELPLIGKAVKKGDSVAVVESVKAASDVYAPISGTITEVNTALAENPALLNQDPYGSGWIMKLSMSNPEELNSLLQEEDYNLSIEEH
ncbi:MAG: glycine cleavage system protein H [Gammaproteobacteria bacterium RIFCSPHIGHO2_12_FULL_41_15]|nr:MAG: glycine cleavage system protein H [Gammaproteobacteria bacterium RIFCSPHIGHO2_12_FULL_41_15]